MQNENVENYDYSYRVRRRKEMTMTYDELTKLLKQNKTGIVKVSKELELHRDTVRRSTENNDGVVLKAYEYAIKYLIMKSEIE